jgi:protein tyrosine/serine phosphatase
MKRQRMHSRSPWRAQLLAVVAAAGLLAAGCATTHQGPRLGSTGHAFAELQPEAPIPNFAVIDSGLARGGQPDAAGFRWLAAHGYRTVIDLRKGHTDVTPIAGTGLRLVEIPTQADLWGSSAPADSQVALFFATVLDTAARPVYFHCKRGKDRTGMYAALQRIELDGWTRAEAMEEMHAFGYSCFFKDLIRYVRDYKPRGYAGRK